MPGSSLRTSSLLLCLAFTAACGSSGHSSSDVATPPSSDTDSDGVPADQDLCPNTPAGVAVDGNGCSAPQRTQSGASAQSSDDGAVTPNGFAVFVLDPKGAVPVVLRTLASNVEHLANGGFALTGTVLIDAPNDAHITLAEAKVTLSYDASKGEGLQGFDGMVRLPFPNLGFMQGVSVDNRVYAAVGYDVGRNIPNVSASVDAERKYLYFAFSTGFTANVGDLSISSTDTESVTMTLDPSDPAFFLQASLSGLLGAVDEAGVGLSIGGKFPFAPTSTWSIDAKVANGASFDGHLWIGGKVDLNHLERPLPLVIGGNTIVNVDPNADGKSVFTDAAGGYQFGSNSDLAVSISAGVLGLDIPIAEGTAFGGISGKTGAAYYSGKVIAGNGWLPDAVPLKNSAPLKAAGLVSTTLADTYFKAQGDWSLDASKLGSWTGLDLTDVAMAQATLNADQAGLTVTGSAATSISPYIGLKGDLATMGFFDGKAKDWYVTLDGKFAVSGVELGSDAHARLDQTGMAITGTFQTPLSDVSMLGSITHGGVDLEGSAPVAIAIVAGKELTQMVTDAAICGTETVTDATLCGSQDMANGAVCGYDTVTDATLCGTNTVKDPALCGTTTAQNQAECGTHNVTDASICGYTVYNDVAHCGTCGLFQSCSCTVVNTCPVASTCTYPNSCPIPAKCQIAKTCPVAKSCPKAKTCETHVTVPDFDYGSFDGTGSVKIGNDGLEGSVSGQYCATGAACAALIGGRVTMSRCVPEACVTVDEVGEVCAGF